VKEGPGGGGLFRGHNGDGYDRKHSPTMTADQTNEKQGPNDNKIGHKKKPTRKNRAKKSWWCTQVRCARSMEDSQMNPKPNLWLWIPCYE
jgi:hypothetical protein